MDGDVGRLAVEMDGPEWLVVTMDVEGNGPERVMQWFLDARLVNEWWGSEAMIEPRLGGRYVVHWLEAGWTMRGVVAHVSLTELVYSWAWDHEPDQVPRVVQVRAEAREDGARLTLVHGPYREGSSGDPEAVTDRAGHLEGWVYFLPRLHAKISATTTD